MSAQTSDLPGLVTFELAGRNYATSLAVVREVVRLQGLTELPGMQPPLAGVVDLRGQALAVLDLRRGNEVPDRGDVLVIERRGETVGVAVDAVRAVLPPDLPAAGGAHGALPPYVRDVLRGPDGIVFHVDLVEMIDALAHA